MNTKWYRQKLNCSLNVQNEYKVVQKANSITIPAIQMHYLVFPFDISKTFGILKTL